MTMTSVMVRGTHSFVSSGWLREQGAHAHQIERRRREDEGPVDARATAMPQLAQHADGLHPAEALLDQLPLLLADRVARMAGRAGIDRTATLRRLGILGDMRGDPHLAEQVHEAFRVVVLVAADRHATSVWPIGHHRPGRVTLPRPRRW